MTNCHKCNTEIVGAISMAMISDWGNFVRRFCKPCADNHPSLQWHNTTEKECDQCERSIHYKTSHSGGWRINRKKHHFCDDKCAGNYYNAERARIKESDRENTICKQCGDAFTPPRNDAKYCSGKCKQKAYNHRKLCCA